MPQTKRLTIKQYEYVPAAKDFVESVVGILDVSAGGVEVVRGGDGWLELRVLDPSTGNSLGPDSPLEWAELVPMQLERSGLAVEVHELDSAKPAEREAPPTTEPVLVGLSAAVQHS